MVVDLNAFVVDKVLRGCTYFVFLERPSCSVGADDGEINVDVDAAIQVPSDNVTMLIEDEDEMGAASRLALLYVICH
jgi:hypothetical protein